LQYCKVCTKRVLGTMKVELGTKECASFTEEVYITLWKVDYINTKERRIYWRLIESWDSKTFFWYMACVHNKKILGIFTTYALLFEWRSIYIAVINATINSNNLISGWWTGILNYSLSLQNIERSSGKMCTIVFKQLVQNSETNYFS